MTHSYYSANPIGDSRSPSCASVLSIEPLKESIDLCSINNGYIRGIHWLHRCRDKCCAATTACLPQRSHLRDRAFSVMDTELASAQRTDVFYYH
ncbi:hypothetical protein OSTOST_20529 [Ostertagia ostertagi]